MSDSPDTANSPASGDKPEQITIFDIFESIVGPRVDFAVTAGAKREVSSRVYELAVRHAVHQFKGDPPNADEELRTSALMGYLGGYLAMYNIIGALSGGKPASLLWNAQPKKSSGLDGEDEGKIPGEDLTGGDFGVALEVGENKYRMAFFQAKNDLVTDNESHLNISQVSSSYSTKTQEGKEASSALFNWVESGATIVPTKRCDFQVFKLACSEAAAFRNGNTAYTTVAGENWAHYVVWRNNGLPVCVPLDKIRAYLHERKYKVAEALNESEAGLGRKVSSIPLDAKNPHDQNQLKTSSFAEFLVSGLDSTSEGWVTVDIDKAKEIIGALSPLGANWFIAEDKGRGGGLVNSSGDALNGVAGFDVKALDSAIEAAKSTSLISLDALSKIFADAESAQLTNKPKNSSASKP